MSRYLTCLAALFAVFLLASACSADTELSVVAADDPEAPIPVEPDGGIGDGAGPLSPADEEPGLEGDWHGAELAETNCPDLSWKRVEATVFSFSVPADFTDQQAQGIDSEVAVWASGGIEVTYDYGWYSGPLDQQPGPVEVMPIDYSGFAGTYVVATVGNAYGDRGFVGVHFDEVEKIDGQTNLLNLIAFFTEPDDEIIARCIVGSLDWKIEAP